MSDPVYSDDPTRLLVRPIPGAPAFGTYERAPGRTRLMRSFVRDSPGAAPSGMRIRVAIQVRTGVQVTTSVHQYGGNLIRNDLDNAIALGAMGGDGARRLTWVQTVTTDPERIVEWDGHTYVQDIARRGESAPGDASFLRFGRTWQVDTWPTSTSARYGHIGIDLAPVGYPRGEIIYDQPSHFVGVSMWLANHPEVERVERTFFAESFLFERGADELLSRIPPVAIVKWQCRQVYGRRNQGGPAEVLGYSYPDAVSGQPTPPGLQGVLATTFSGR